MESSSNGCYRRFLRRAERCLPGGFLDRLTSVHPRHLGHVNELLNRLQADHPRLTYDIIWSAGDEVRKVPRLLQMVDSGGIPAEFLRGLEHGVGDRELTSGEPPPSIGPPSRGRPVQQWSPGQAAVHLLYGRLHLRRRTPDMDLLRHESRLREVLPKVLEHSLEGIGREPNFWMQLVEDVACFDMPRAVELVAGALTSQNHNAQR